MISTWIQDVRYALRQLRKTPGFTVTAVLTLALGIGANAAIFTLVHAVLLKSLPVADPKTLVRVGDHQDCCILNLASMQEGDYSIFSTEAYRYLRDHTPEFEELAAVQAAGSGLDLSARRGVPVTVSGGDEVPHSSRGQFVSGNYFQTFGVQPFAGRALMPSDDVEGAAPVAMLSYQAWQRDYAGNSSVVGSSFILNTHPVTIVGITPQSFYGDRMTEYPPDLYLPLSAEPTFGQYHVFAKPSLGWLFLIGRMKPGTARMPLQEKISGLLQQELGQLEDFQTVNGKKTLTRTHVVLTEGGAGIAQMQNNWRDGLYLLIGLSGLVLLIACANIANLMLVRGIARRTETSIRMALGAARTRIVRQMVTESVVLACLGGMAGLLVAYAGTKLLLGLMFTNSPELPIHASPSLAVFGFAFVLSLLTGLIFGLAPAWITSKEQPANAMRGSNRSTKDSSSLVQRSLVVLQAALSLVLLVGAGLFSKSLNNMQHQNFGIETANRVIVQLNPQKAGYKPEQLQGLYDQIEQKFHAIPGVERVGLTMYTPLQGDNWSFYVYVQGQRPPDPGSDVSASFNRASPDYFKAIGQRVVQGRAFTASDTATSAGVGIVNQAFVKKMFKPGENPIGQHFGMNKIANSGDYEIVGIVEDSRYQDARQLAPPMSFLPMLQPSHTNTTADVDASLYVGAIVLQMKAITPGLEASVHKTLSNINPNLTVDHYQTFAQQVSGNFNGQRMIAQLTLLFGVLALVLACVGLYGMTSYTVVRRTSEIGIRMALGAARGNVISMVLRTAMLQAVIGLAIGVPTAMFCVRYVKSQLYNMDGQNAGIMTIAVLVLAAAAFVAGMIPARRAARIEPMEALRTE